MTTGAEEEGLSSEDSFMDQLDTMDEHDDQALLAIARRLKRLRQA